MGKPDNIIVYGSFFERVNSFKFLGVHITEDLAWDKHTGYSVKKKHSLLSPQT